MWLVVRVGQLVYQFICNANVLSLTPCRLWYILFSKQSTSNINTHTHTQSLCPMAVLFRDTSPEMKASSLTLRRPLSLSLPNKHTWLKKESIGRQRYTCTYSAVSNELLKANFPPTHNVSVPMYVLLLTFCRSNLQNLFNLLDPR